MLIKSTNNINYNAVLSEQIYTRDRQIEYRDHLQQDTEAKKINPMKFYIAIIIVAIIIFSACAGMLYFKSIISKMQLGINDINSEVRIVEQENSRLKADKINAIDIDSIKISATKMGMSLPQSNQVEYVNTLDSDEGTALNLID
jgi:cell division protein FtsL